jgi:hypothetical protein
MYWGAGGQPSIGETWQTTAFVGTLDKSDSAKTTISGLLKVFYEAKKPAEARFSVIRTEAAADTVK